MIYIAKHDVVYEFLTYVKMHTQKIKLLNPFGFDRKC